MVSSLFVVLGETSIGIVGVFASEKDARSQISVFGHLNFAIIEFQISPAVEENELQTCYVITSESNDAFPLAVVVDDNEAERVFSAYKKIYMIAEDDELRYYKRKVGIIFNEERIVKLELVNGQMADFKEFEGEIGTAAWTIARDQALAEQELERFRRSMTIQGPKVTNPNMDTSADIDENMDREDNVEEIVVEE